MRRTSRAAANRRDTSTTLARPAQQPQYPRVLCFFMVSRNLAVRYGIWGKRCAMFAITTNGLDEGEGGGGPQYLDNNTTILLDVQYIIREELLIRNWHNSIHATEGRHAGFITFPSPSQETKNHLSLKSFYAWIYLSRHYSNNYTTADGPNIDYIMKVDPDTYMIMDNYLSYLHEYYTPQQHAYIGRVFKSEGNVNDPFVSGLSVTLSTATTSLLLSQSSILQYVNIDNNNNNNNNEDETISTTAATTSGGAANKQEHQQQSYECSAERFVFGGAADDHTLSRCLMSLGIYPSYTRDDSGRHERFMHYSPTDHYPTIPSVSTSNVLIKYDANDKKHEEPEWYAKFSWTPYSSKQGCCSSVACAFHYVGMDKQNSTLVWDKLFHTWHWEK
jgi:hypothetical protein